MGKSKPCDETSMSLYVFCVKSFTRGNNCRNFEKFIFAILVEKARIPSSRRMLSPTPINLGMSFPR